ncbi:MAG: hypothetical protein JNK76_23270 [Planctomycetales bacterium]|nr:hypothetical protein [Planctomycetales bacterium]
MNFDEMTPDDFYDNCYQEELQRLSFLRELAKAEAIRRKGKQAAKQDFERQAADDGHFDEFGYRMARRVDSFGRVTWARSPYAKRPERPTRY